MCWALAPEGSLSSEFIPCVGIHKCPFLRWPTPAFGVASSSLCPPVAVSLRHWIGSRGCTVPDAHFPQDRQLGAQLSVFGDGGAVGPHCCLACFGKLPAAPVRNGCGSGARTKATSSDPTRSSISTVLSFAQQLPPAVSTWADFCPKSSFGHCYEEKFEQ